MAGAAKEGEKRNVIDGQRTIAVISVATSSQHVETRAFRCATVVLCASLYASLGQNPFSFGIADSTGTRLDCERKETKTHHCTSIPSLSSHRFFFRNNSKENARGFDTHENSHIVTLLYILKSNSLRRVYRVKRNTSRLHKCISRFSPPYEYIIN